MASHLIALTLLACGAPESGIDDTVLVGTARILPRLVDEGEGSAASNDVPEAAMPLGAGGGTDLGLAPVILRGSTASFPTETEPAGDVDHFQFLPFAAGTLTLTVDVAGAGHDYAVGVYDVETGDPAAGEGVLAWEETSGASHVELTVDTDGARMLGVVVWGITGPEGAVDVPWRVRITGADPASVDVLVGAYGAPDGDAGALPLAGASVTDWTWDDATSSWSGGYVMYGLRAVSMRADDDTGDDILPPPDVREGADVVYLRGGTMPDLLTPPAPGDLTRREAVEVNVTGGRQVLSEVVELDWTVPRRVGVRWAETGDSDGVFGEVDGTWSLDTTGVVAQDLGEASPADWSDLLDGVIDFAPDVVGWDGNDVDVYAFTVPETLGVSMTVSWSDPTMDLDAGVFGDAFGDGSHVDLFSLGETYCATSDNPEVCETGMDVVLDPGQTYYLAVAGYSGAGPMPYRVELSWFVP
jgi:hypothetical protein